MDAPLQLPLHPLPLLPREKERPRFTVRIRWIPSVVCMPRNWPRWKPNESVNWKNNVLDVVDLWRPMAEGQEMCLLPLQEPLLRHELRGLPRARIRPNLPMDTICDESLVEPAMYRPENPLLGKKMYRFPLLVPLGREQIVEKERISWETCVTMSTMRLFLPFAIVQKIKVVIWIFTSPLVMPEMKTFNSYVKGKGRNMDMASVAKNAN